MRWVVLCARSFPVAVLWTGLTGVGWAHAGPSGAVPGDIAVAPESKLSLPHVHVTNNAAIFPDDAHASELEDRHCKTPLVGADPCGDAFDVASDATLTVTLVSTKDGGEDKRVDAITVIVHDNTHNKDQKNQSLTWGQSFNWKNDSGEQIKVQLKAKGPTISLARDIHIRYEITE